MGIPVIKKGTMTHKEAIGKIIESIAMEENALAHILNAESEKIMAVVNNANATQQQLLAINRSVKKTINAVTRFELTLQAKLDLFQPILCE